MPSNVRHEHQAEGIQGTERGQCGKSAEVLGKIDLSASGGSFDEGKEIILFILDNFGNPGNGGFFIAEGWKYGWK